jgi:Mn2+/Fe2+ NRAMP family transporter
MNLVTDSYLTTEKLIKDPPTTFLKRLRFLGPGFILSASIVGSGELIATTILGAEAGFTALWIILISCLAKVAVQLEFGKHAILIGETSVKGFNQLPGLKIQNGNWALWIYFILQTMKVVQIGGILGGTSVVLHLLFPSLPITFWALFTALISTILIYNGKYEIVEKVSLVMVAMFTILTVSAVCALQFTPFNFSLTDILSGLNFNLRAETVAVAFGAFGITGVASDEIIAYNYWCIEKGYAAYTGPREETEKWKERARGWINVMYLDAIVAMIVYTLVTVAFYILGAAVLHGRGSIPQGNEVIETLALIYTQSLGNGVRIIYLVGAFFVLFSSVFATLAAWTRIFPNIFGEMGWIDFHDLSKRKKAMKFLSIFFPSVWAIAYLYIQLPVLMVLSGGIIGSAMLLLVVAAALHFKIRRKPILETGFFYNLIFWTSVISILLVAVYGLLQILS